MSIKQLIEELNTFLSGWVTYFRYAECKSVLHGLDGWVRRKLRCLRLKQCRFLQPVANCVRWCGRTDAATRLLPDRLDYGAPHHSTGFIPFNRLACWTCANFSVR